MQLLPNKPAISSPLPPQPQRLQALLEPGCWLGAPPCQPPRPPQAQPWARACDAAASQPAHRVGVEGLGVETHRQEKGDR